MLFSSLADQSELYLYAAMLLPFLGSIYSQTPNN